MEHDNLNFLRQNNIAKSLRSLIGQNWPVHGKKQYSMPSLYFHFDKVIKGLWLVLEVPDFNEHEKF